MTHHSDSTKTALVLPGGGARGAFQVGVLKALAEILPRNCQNPFPVISGTSAGAVISVVLASKAEHFRSAVTELEYVWSHFRCEQVFKTDHLTMLKSSLHWLSSIVLGGWLVGTPKSLLDNSPLRDLLSRNVHFPRIHTSIENGNLDAVAVTAASYGSARSETFFEGAARLRGWHRTRRLGERTELNLDHIMASIAVPLIFPPQSIGNEYFGDGAMRQATPLSPAVHLGADRILVIGIRDESGEEEATELGPLPSFAQIAGYMLDTLFMDGLYSDLERITRLNELIDSVPEQHRNGSLANFRPIDTMLVVPSEDLREIAFRHRQELPFAIRALLRGVGGRTPRESKLISFLLFERAFTRELIALGYRDAMKVKDQLLDFVCGAQVPRLFAPDWIKRDLSSFHADEI
ncbi:MAG: patatin-like phospholipase family protein [Gammaproteobacteria bacterium]|nr:patatin-like phospholipase family protein [Gammaproteobacteria bacterium]MDH5240108.1 patatin-like phospholipase family protein [Gammaproteobacteria bacterium]MDH5260072.1 patatin-like phospholipase family protein [Gammaproteobacteria bacterium]MDH5584933.1 patatin-like phospholipase family protein [Gammaproteobacteria bacterium]